LRKDVLFFDEVVFFSNNFSGRVPTAEMERG